MDLRTAGEDVERFQGNDLGGRIGHAESVLRSSSGRDLKVLLPTLNVFEATLSAAFVLKTAAAQVNVLIHSLGILLSLPTILADDEVIEFLSLEAGNTGRPFDLETDRRVAEFKFINWRGGSESIRQNSLFKDFYLLAEATTPKRKQLFVTGERHPLRFLEGGRSLSSVMSRNRKLWEDFVDRYSDTYLTVRDYYQDHRADVEIVDLNKLLPVLFLPLPEVPPASDEDREP